MKNLLKELKNIVLLWQVYLIVIQLVKKNVSQQFREKYLDKYIDLENNLNNNSFELALDFYELSSNESNCNLVIN